MSFDKSAHLWFYLTLLCPGNNQRLNACWWVMMTHLDWISPGNRNGLILSWMKAEGPFKHTLIKCLQCNEQAIQKYEDWQVLLWRWGKKLLVCFTYKWIVHTCGSLTLYFILSHLYQTNNDCGRKALTMWILKVENWFINLKTSHLEMCGGSWKI